MATILVIEDEARTRNLMLDCLLAEGFETIEAEDGRVGVQRAQEQLPDLVICDIAMPKLDGYGVLNSLRQDPSTASIPFLFLTAIAPEAEHHQQEPPPEDYLAKPATVDLLLSAVARKLEAVDACQSSPGADEASRALPEPSSIFPNVPWLKNVFHFIEANFQQRITLCDVAQAVGYSPAYLTNLVGSQTGRTVNRWIVERRMAEARSLLQQTDLSGVQIARAVGYENTRHFFRQFNQYHGTTPQAWRENNRLAAQLKNSSARL